MGRSWVDGCVTPPPSRRPVLQTRALCFIPKINLQEKRMTLEFILLLFGNKYPDDRGTEVQGSI